MAVNSFHRAILISLFVLLAMLPKKGSACPFCSALASPLREDLDRADAAFLAVCIGSSAATEVPGQKAYQFQISASLKPNSPKLPTQTIPIHSSVAYKLGDTSLIMGVAEEETWIWGDFGQLTPAACDHLKRLPNLSQIPHERIRYFLPLLDSPDPLVSSDAFNEFALASFEDLRSLRALLNNTQIATTIRDPKTSTESRKLYWTLLSIAGTQEDLPFVENAIASHRPGCRNWIGIDAALSCYLSLGGVSALEKIENWILKNPDANYLDVNAAILAIRVHGNEIQKIPRERLCEALKIVLGSPDLADLVIPDLARWNDWRHVDRMVELFASCKPENQYVKVPAVRYLTNCPLPTAPPALEACKQMDPQTVRRALVMFPPSHPLKATKNQTYFDE